jgi:hypothetical protein
VIGRCSIVQDLSKALKVWQHLLDDLMMCSVQAVNNSYNVSNGMPSVVAVLLRLLMPCELLVSAMS